MIATTTTAILPTKRAFFSDAFLLIAPLYISSETAEAVTRSCESAVDIIAARIPQRKIPPMKMRMKLPSKIWRIVLINTVSLVVLSRVSFKKPLAKIPKNEAAPSERITQTIAMILDFLTSASDLIAMNLTRMCGIPK